MSTTAEIAATPEPTDGFATAEGAAMKQCAAELRAEGKAGAKKADGVSAVLERIAEMATDDRMYQVLGVRFGAAARRLTERVHVTYSALGFNDNATLDDGDMWPTAYAITTWNPVVERRVSELVGAACR